MKNLIRIPPIMIIAAVGALLPLPQAHAMLIAECADIKYIESQAIAVVEGEVTDVEYKKESDSHVFTFVTVRADKYVKGEGPSTIIIKQFGGTYEENGQTYTIADADSPSFQVGEKGTLYLDQPDTPFYAGEFYTTVCATGIENKL